MPGIPPPESIESSTFWLSFWAALYSGIIYSIITGIIVGIALWWIQLGAESRRDRKSYKRQLALLQVKLRFVIDQPDAINVTSPEKALPQACVHIANLLQESPLDIWRKVLPKEDTALIELLQQIQDDYFMALSEARKLDAALKVYIRKFNSDKKLIDSNDLAPYVYFLGKMFKAEDEEILPWTGLSMNNIPENIKEFYSKIRSDSEVEMNANNYLMTRKKLSEHLDRLSKMVK